MGRALRSEHFGGGPVGDGGAVHHGMILIVDDDLKLCATMERLFRLAGYEVICAHHPVEVLPILGVQRPAGIVLDLKLPGMDGLMLLQAIRADPVLSGVPVLIYTGDFSESNEALSRQFGAQDYLVKGTVSAEVLLDRVHEVILSGPPRLGQSGS